PADDWRVADADRELAWLERLGKVLKEDRGKLPHAPPAPPKAEHPPQEGKGGGGPKVARTRGGNPRELPPPDALWQADAQGTLGAVHQARGEFEQAARAMAAARALRVKLLGAKHPLVAESLNNIGNLLREAGELAPARKFLEEARGMYRELGLA